jgi:hypothetical protein
MVGVWENGEDPDEGSVYCSMPARQRNKSWSMWRKVAVFFRKMRLLLGPYIWIRYQMLLHTFKASR